MSTQLLFAICALLVFSPFLLEVARALVRLAIRFAPRRAAPPPPDFGATFESSVYESLYDSEPRWQKLEVRTAEPGAGPPSPPYVVGRPETGAPLHSVRRELEPAPDEPAPEYRAA